MVAQFQIQTKDGSNVLLRPLVPSDEPALARAIDSFSRQSRYLRFFNGASTLPEHVIHKLADVDGDQHIAWAAIDADAPGQPVIGAVHAIRPSNGSHEGDFAIGLVDAWHGKGIARLLIALLAADSLAHGMDQLTADVLWENRKGRALMAAVGAVSKGSDSISVHYHMPLAEALNNLKSAKSNAAMETVLGAIAAGSFQPQAA